MPIRQAKVIEQMNEVVIMDNNTPTRMSRLRNALKFGGRGRSNSSDDEGSMMLQIESRFGAERLEDGSSAMDASIAVNDLSEDASYTMQPSYTMPLKAESDDPQPLRKKSSIQRRRSKDPPIRGILRVGSSSLEGEQRQPSGKSKSDKRLSFALSPTFISDSNLQPIRRNSFSDSFAESSMHSLDGDELFADDPDKKDASLVMGESSSERSGGHGHRRNSMNNFKSKSSLGFDERFVGFNESDLGSLGHASWSSL